jgi:hypothetical protein
MDQLEVHEYWLPIDWSDARAAIAPLRMRDVLTPAFYHGADDLYDPLLYRNEEASLGTRTTIILDRNVFTRVVAIARGEPCRDDHRLAASIMVLSQASNIILEPSHALYEVAYSQGQSVAEQEYAIFRNADNAPLQEWASLALGRTDRACLGSSPAADREEVDFAMPLRQWRRNYIALLKLADLVLTSRSPYSALLSFIDWLHLEFEMKAAAVALAAIYCAPNTPRAGMLKGLYKTDRTKALAGVRNAAWDLLLVNNLWERSQSVDQDNSIAMLASFDRGVHAVARLFTEPETSTATPEGAVVNALSQVWPVSTARRLGACISHAVSNREASVRKANRPDAQQDIDELIADGERTVLRWNPGERGT